MMKFIADARRVMSERPYLWIAPGIATVLCFAVSPLLGFGAAIATLAFLLYDPDPYA